jgi:hypothetical protein
MCWALSYQRRPDTLVVLDRPELVANPFDADPSDTIVVSNALLGPFNADMAKGLRAWLRRRHDSDGTAVLQTPGLTNALANRAAFWHLEEQAYWNDREYRKRTWIDRVNGCVVLAAPPAVLRAWGVSLSELGTRIRNGSDASELDWPAGNGEVQVFPDFLVRVTDATTKRARLFPGSEHRALEQHEREAVWAAR